MAVNMVEAVKKELGIDMPLSSLIKNNTIERLALALTGQVSESPEILVEIQSEGTLTPIFGIHAEGNVIFYRDLAESLGKDQPFYGLQTPELGGGREMFQSIEEMASAYIREIKSVKPDGPYIIAGMCFGSWIGFEMSQQLKESGDEVEALFIFDSEGPRLCKEIKHESASKHSVRASKIRSPSTKDTLVSDSKNGFDLVRKKLEDLKDKVTGWWSEKLRYHREAPLWVKAMHHYKTGRLKEISITYMASYPLVYRLLQKLWPDTTETSTTELIQKIKLNQLYLKRKYCAKAYEGDIVFIRSAQYESNNLKEHHIPRWETVCEKKVISHLIEGRHMNIMDPPQVYEVADLMQKHLSKDP